MKRRTLWGMMAVYAILVGGIVWVLFEVRTWAVETYSSPQEAQNWEELRESLQEGQNLAHPTVKRPPQRSAEPPIKTLFSENFLSVVTWAVAILSILYWSVGIMIAGALRTSNQIHAPPQDDAAP